MLDNGLVVTSNVESKARLIKSGELESIKCSNCQKELLKVYCGKMTDTMYKICVQCPFCSDKSFDYEVKGMFHYVPVEEVLLLDIDTDDKNNRITIKTKAKS